MKWIQKRWVKKLFLLAFLAIAGILVGEVVGYLMRPGAEDLLLSLKAEKVHMQSLYVNGRSLTAEVWQLPATSSSDPLKKAADKLLVVGKTVYVFKDDFGSSKGQCDVPVDLPTAGLQCDYVVETGNMRAVIATTTLSRTTFFQTFGAQAEALGWRAELPQAEAFLWSRNGKLLMVRMKEFPNQGEAQVALVETRSAS